MKYIGTFLKETPIPEIIWEIQHDGYDISRIVFEDIGDGMIEANVIE